MNHVLHFFGSPATDHVSLEANMECSERVPEILGSKININSSLKQRDVPIQKSQHFLLKGEQVTHIPYNVDFHISVNLKIRI